MVPELCNISVW